MIIHERNWKAITAYLARSRSEGYPQMTQKIIRR